MFLVDHLCQHEACLELNAARPPLPGPTPAHSAPASVIGSLPLPGLGEQKCDRDQTRHHAK